MPIFNSTAPFLKRLRQGTHQDPMRDWLILLSLSAIALAGIIVWNVWAFDTVVGGGTIGPPATKAPEVFSRSSLEAIRTVFTNRAEEGAKYDTGVYRFADPSQ